MNLASVKRSLRHYCLRETRVCVWHWRRRMACVRRRTTRQQLQSQAKNILKNDKNKLKEIVEELNQTLPSEIYISYLYDKLLHQKNTITPIYIESPIVIGTPFQLQLYSSSNLSSLSNKRFCFDLDNTLVSYPEGKDYSTVEPLQQNIEYLKKLKENGAYIIIYTARRMRTHNGDVSKVIADIGEITTQTLKKLNIPYDELHFGKPYAHFYIDDLAIDANTDLSKHIGYYFNTIESRSKHLITYNNEICVKEGNLEGESFFYKNAPDELKNKYFPKFFSIEDKKIEMEKINGIPLSHLYTRGDLNEIILNKVFDGLNDFHSYKQIDFNLDPNANYKEKIISRYEEIVGINQSAKTILDNILEKLKSYDCSNVCLIHGDPVFSNIFYTENGNLKFIDVRGKLNETYSLYGDEMYDWAKLYQSIIGYDFILLNKHLDFEIIEKWKCIFEQKFIDQFNKKKLNQLKFLTESLLVTCIPFHPKSKSSSFLNLIKTFLT